MTGKNEKSVYICSNCGYIAYKWFGKCPNCGEWNTAVKTSDTRRKSNKQTHEKMTVSKPVLLDEVAESKTERFKTGIGEFDRVLGGGIVPGSLILIGGEPGIGKSTLLLQSSNNISGSGERVLYVSGEESPYQIRMRANRLFPSVNGKSLFLLSATNIDTVIMHIRSEGFKFVVIDSIQTMYSSDLDSIPGSINQLKECSNKLREICKTEGVTIFIIGHVTKGGYIAGPKLLEHMVDTVLYFEGEKGMNYRLIRAAKNRFGPTSEIGVFEMTDKGLIEIENPSAFFLGEMIRTSGNSITVIMEGSRPIILEIQSLASKTPFGVPRRMAKGIDFAKLIILSAVLEKRMGLPLSSYDIYVNVSGGIKIKEPSADLAIAAAIFSSFMDIALPSDMAFIGEVGLDGRIRSVGFMDRRLKELAKYGITRIVTTRVKKKEDVFLDQNLEVVQASNLIEALSKAKEIASEH